MLRLVRPMGAFSISLLVLTGCAGGTASEASEADAAPVEATADPSELAPSESAAAESGAPSPGGATCAESSEEQGATCQIVLGTANVFGAGHDEAPAPPDGGPGLVPPVWEIPEGATHMAITDAVGSVGHAPSSRGNGPEGSGTSLGLQTDINSYGGISGIVNRANGMFLVGVFLTDQEPQEGDHPDRLGFTDKEDFTELAPLIGQTFFVGDGRDKTIVIPQGATRVFLGFADGLDMRGDPGWYGNNSGQLAVTVSFGE